ncbi:MAG: orotate phosphoribosyltransferase, partial [Gammaproteobacteria bacterium]|nr:orotate phosphoribosyltransferase [Gammaproteobacteria bacterium]
VSDRVLIVDDVITAGTAIREADSIIREAGGQPAGVLLALDRQEKGTGELSAVQEVEQSLGLPVFSIVRLEDLVTHLQNAASSDAVVDSVLAYRERYGA